MREIKFRAWCKSAKMMAIDIHREYDTIAGVRFWKDGEETEQEPGGSCFGSYLNNDDYEVTQFTGLKDKNGKDIYEGDIVNWPGFDGNIYQVCYDRWGIPALAGIKNCEGGDFKEFEMQYNATPSKCEILGNIYESPELLENK